MLTHGKSFAKNHDKGEKFPGTIKSITDFGIFIGLPGGIDGLVHLSDISWNEQGEEAIRRYKKGDTVAAVILSVDAEGKPYQPWYQTIEQRSIQ